MTGKIITLIILIAIIVACFFIIKKKIKEIRQGKLCSCSHCDGCCSSCEKKKKDE